jgi:peptidyl-prolyl cis-trans isomerase B (cyclophilin B)
MRRAVAHMVAAFRRTAILAAALAGALLLFAAAPAARAATEEVAVVRTPLGEITWRFLPKDAPGHVRYVKELIAAGFYDGTTFHRVIPHFVVQGGDPNSKNDDRADDGEGQADRRLKAEFSDRLHYRPGTVGMARDVDPDSGSCQFFIAIADIPRLDGRYTIFAEVVDGLEIARRIASLPRDLNDNPLVKVPVSIRLEKRAVRDGIASLDVSPTGSGEILTGPDKPRPYDPKNRLWTAPALARAPIAPDPAVAAARLDVAIGANGKVLDVRFARADTPQAERLWAMAMAWTFTPAVYDGTPRSTRIAIDADGSDIGPPTGGGAPIDVAAAGAAPVSVTGAAPAAGEGVTPPHPAIRVTLAPGTKPPPRPARFRLTVDAAGAVTDAALQESCGDAALDARAAEAAKMLLFTPATRPAATGNDREPVAVYLDVEARFVE